MEIRGTGDAARLSRIRRILDRRRAAAAGGAEGGEGVGAADDLALSTVARLLGELDRLPAVRAERVARLRERIEDGTYETEDKLEAAVERILLEFQPADDA